jgi:hypothetical protein
MPDKRGAVLKALKGPEDDAMSEIASMLNEIASRHRAYSQIGAIDEPPSPPHPGIFQADKPITGDPEFARTAERMMDLSPYVKEGVKSIMVGPTNTVIRDLERSGFEPQEFGLTNLAGQTAVSGPHKGEIAINPERALANQKGTMVHEFTHVANPTLEDDENSVPETLRKFWHRLLQQRVP